MESLSALFQNIVGFAVPMIVLLGLLIFVHELGHFLVAKYFGVRVEVFSLGFGPKIFKILKGDTEYAISAVPLGGYVKMFGDDPSSEVRPDQKSYAFNHKPVAQRIAIVLAGPLMNLFFAAVLFSGVANLGEQALMPKLGDIDANSMAYTAGFRSGDTIESINGTPIQTWDDLQGMIEANAEKQLSFGVRRGSDQTSTIQATPDLVPNKNVLSWSRLIGEIKGLTPSSRAPLMGIRPGSILAVTGLETGDFVQEINGTKINHWRELVDYLQNHVDEQINLIATRGVLDEATRDKDISSLMTHAAVFKIPKELKGKSSQEILDGIGLEFPELYLAGIEPGSPAEKAGLKKGDRILSINDQKVDTFDQVAGIVRSYKQQEKSANPVDNQTKPLAVVVQRNSEQLTIGVSPNEKERMNNNGREERRFEIGIRPMIADSTPAIMTLAFSNPLAAVKRGLVLTWKWSSLTVLSFVRLFQAEVSPKNIGGFLSIGKMAQSSWQRGVSHFLSVMGIISINLFILNLLPVPVLDGGHLVFYTIEAARGAPLSMKKMEMAQQIGLFLLLALMAFALFNDFRRLFS